MSLLFSGVVFLLDFILLRALHRSFTSIQKELFEIRVFSDKFLDGSDPSLWEYNLSSKSLLKKRKILHHPIMRSSLTCAVPEESHHLEREIQPNIGEDEEELFSAGCKESLASSSKSPLLLGFCTSSLDQESFYDLSEGDKKIFKVIN